MSSLLAKRMDSMSGSRSWESAQHAALCASGQDLEQWPQERHVIYCCNPMTENLLLQEIIGSNPSLQLYTVGGLNLLML
jgi:hypothetical protein